MDESIKNEDIRNWSNWSREQIEFLKSYKKDLNEYRKVKSECYSLWCDTLYKLSIANHFRCEYCV